MSAAIQVSIGSVAIQEPASTVITVTDEEIVQLVREGQPQEFEQLIRRHSQRLYRVCRSIVRTEQEAEQLMRDSYVRAHSNLRQYKATGRFAMWLTKIAVYQGLPRVRRERRADSLDALKELIRAGAEKAYTERFRDSEQTRQALESAVDTLPPIYRSVYIMRCVEGLSGRETAECLEATEEAVKMRLHRGKSALRMYFADAMDTVGAEIFPFHRHRCDRMVAEVFRSIERQ